MFFKVFKMKWYFPSRGDWTQQVKMDLADFDLPVNLDMISKYSKVAFKKLVKAKAVLYTFDQLCTRKEDYRKLKNIQYSELKTQDYLLSHEITHDEKITIFRLRTRMSDFGFNFRAGRDQIRCPLCGQHPDCQTFLFKCPELKSSLYEKFGPNSYDSIDEIFSETISVETIRVIKFAMDLRKTKLKDEVDKLSN